ncbi:MAG TPA: prepilin-type N-terminal cleavage/methylation domain-containing protein [Holophagaceae bacterium]|nr:prepilin-type N-terminal cleavage/methylation domain-containing protein [Holophagaceae bacterium]
MKTSNSIRRSRRGQSGFSLVELLLAAFVMAVGLLGLTSLQAMSIRATTSTGRMQDAIRLAEQILEQISAEGTQSYLGEIYQSKAPAPMKWINAGATVTDYYQYRTVADAEGEKGTLRAGTAADNAFTVTVNQVETVPAGGPMLAQVTVQVQFMEGMVGGVPVMRTVTFTREVLHA